MIEINLQRIRSSFADGKRHVQLIRTLLLIWAEVGLSFINVFLNYKQKELHFYQTSCHKTQSLKRNISD